MKKIVIKSSSVVRPDGQLIRFRAGAVIDTDQFDGGVVTQVESVLADHSSDLESAVSDFLKLHPGSEDVSPAVAIWFVG